MKKYLTLNNLSWLLTLISVFMLGSAGVTKLVGTSESISNFKFMNLSEYMFIIGLFEFVFAVGILLPKVSNYAIVGVTAIMGAAVAMHLSLMGGVGVLNPILVGILAWSGHCIRKYKS